MANVFAVNDVALQVTSTSPGPAYLNPAPITIGTFAQLSVGDIRCTAVVKQDRAGVFDPGALFVGACIHKAAVTSAADAVFGFDGTTADIGRRASKVNTCRIVCAGAREINGDAAGATALRQVEVGEIVPTTATLKSKPMFFDIAWSELRDAAMELVRNGTALLTDTCVINFVALTDKPARAGTTGTDSGWRLTFVAEGPDVV